MKTKEQVQKNYLKQLEKNRLLKKELEQLKKGFLEGSFHIKIETYGEAYNMVQALNNYDCSENMTEIITCLNMFMDKFTEK